MVETLYEAYHLELVRWCQGMIGNRDTAEELVQEGFLRAMDHEKLLENLDELQGRAWLYRTIKNLYIDQYRHTFRETITEEPPEHMDEPAEITEVEWNILLDALPEEEGMLFRLRYLQGYNSRQISEMFSIPSGTVRSKLSSARKHLKQSIGGKKNG